MSKIAVEVIYAARPIMVEVPLWADLADLEAKHQEAARRYSREGGLHNCLVQSAYWQVLEAAKGENR